MKKQDKVLLVEQLKADLNQAQGAVVMEYKGITVSSLHELRKALRDAGGKLRVVKNTLFKLACQDTPNENLQELAGGPIAIAMSSDDPAALAKAVVAYGKDEKKLKIRGGILSGKLMDEGAVNDLATMPSLDEMRAKALSAFNAPAQKFLSLLQAAPRNLLGVLSARGDKLETQE